jgi:hypothetical protein
MYQTQGGKCPPEEEFERLYKEFINLLKESNSGFSNIESLFTEDNTKYDLDKRYLINHACLWNDPTSMGKECVIAAKNNKIAMVAIQGGKTKTDADLIKALYRLEDLTLLNKPSGISMVDPLMN